ncbi:MAG: DUF4430 domain-containing protein [Lachnospiraceae bacterium]|nr:DUF4430 domain-containing protein [Lachnospiraceae bacterium]
MNRVKWKKLFGVILVVGALIFAFWYGGNAPGLRGFSSDDDSTAVTTEYRTDVDADSASVKQTESNVNTSHDVTKKDTTKITKDNSKKKKGGFFNKIVMNIKHVGSSKKKKNPQLNKRAQKNANKAVVKNEKKNKRLKNRKSKKSTENNNDNNVQNDNIDRTSDEKKDDSDSKKSDNKIEEDTSEKTSEIKDDKPTDKTTETTQTDKNKQEPEEVEDGTITCTIYISCASVLDHMDKLSDATKKIIPENGVMLETYEVKVKDGSTVFDVLSKAARKNKLHLEYNYTPAYKTYYIEGIGNLYEFDAGNLSGWMYSVNDKFPGMGCSGYKVSDGDVIKFVYTCNFGKDVGSSFE